MSVRDLWLTQCIVCKFLGGISLSQRIFSGGGWLWLRVPLVCYSRWRPLLRVQLLCFTRWRLTTALPLLFLSSPPLAPFLCQLLVAGSHLLPLSAGFWPGWTALLVVWLWISSCFHPLSYCQCLSPSVSPVFLPRLCVCLSLPHFLFLLLISLNRKEVSGQ